MCFPPTTPPQRRVIEEPPPLIPFNDDPFWSQSSDLSSPTPSYSYSYGCPYATPISMDSNYSPSPKLDLGFDSFALHDSQLFKTHSNEHYGDFFGNTVTYVDMYVSYHGEFVKWVYGIFELKKLTDNPSIQPIVKSKVDKGFIWSNSAQESFATTYRRNFFQISTKVILQMAGKIAQEEESLSNPLVAVSGHLIPILSFQVGLNASMYDEDAVVEDSVNLVQFSSAREKGPKVKPQRESITALINSTSDDVEAQAVKFERIQFERSTNRKMEKFRLNVTLYAQLENGVDVQVATVKSLPISVRGRSPAHYTDDMYTGRGLPRVKSSQTLRNKMANTMRVSKSTPSLSNTKAREKMSTMTVSGSSKPTLEDLATACEIDMATL